MKVRIHPPSAYIHSLIILMLLGCTELEFNEQGKAVKQDLEMNYRSQLSKSVLDSTRLAESSVSKSGNDNNVSESMAVTTTSTNFAREAVITAESTYPGYSVTKLMTVIATRQSAHRTVGLTTSRQVESFQRVYS